MPMTTSSTEIDWSTRRTESRKTFQTAKVYVRLMLHARKVRQEMVENCVRTAFFNLIDIPANNEDFANWYNVDDDQECEEFVALCDALLEEELP